MNGSNAGTTGRNHLEASKLNKSESFVLFELAGNTCGLRSQSVKSVEMVEQVTSVPNTAPFVEGITFTRGQVIPSINLRILFGFPRVPRDPRARMLVIQPNGRTAGILVDTVREFVSIPAAAIELPGESNDVRNCGAIGRFVEGIAMIGKRLILILNLNEVLDGG
jgi:purine-binding chemotaxis protein CheW